MRVYIPATFAMINRLSETGVLQVRSGYVFGVTPALTEFYTSGDEDELADVAFSEAGRASLRLLAIGDEEKFPHRRVVIAADIADDRLTALPDMDTAVLKVAPAQLTVEDIASVHVDVVGAEDAVRDAIDAVDQADMGDPDAEFVLGEAEDHPLAWYDVSELPFLVELL
ncbi:DUF6912 family protein [Corynebacterium ulceribovis]|uniref:DUF6912 family protein n=1 Tax=Corynebacterium ulceribovis TaxID=487732 RepID=UPI00039A1E59|nr:hypothetical protein [Corynebacterium ulceribovis]